MEYEITDFTKEVIERSSSIPVLVDFWAPWCGPCKVLGPVLEKLAVKYREEWVLAKVNTDVHEDIAARFGVRGIPNVKLFVDGRVANEFTGALPEPMVVQWLARALPNKFRREINRAEQLLVKGDVTEARRLLEDILVKDAENEAARVLLARTHVLSDPGRALDLVQGIEEHQELFPMAEAIATIGRLLQKADHPERLPDDGVKQTYLDAARELASTDVEAALQKFIEVLKVNRDYDEDGSRKACLAIFRVLGDEHPITQQYRRPFSSALYL